MEFLVNSFLRVKTVAIENDLILFGSSKHFHTSNEHFRTISINECISLIFRALSPREA